MATAPQPLTTYVTLNPADISGGGTLSNGNLTITETTSPNPCGSRGTATQTTGKYYWEFTPTVYLDSFTQFGCSTTAGTPTSATAKSFVIQNGTIYVNNVSTGISIGSLASNYVIGVALDLVNGYIWYRIAPSGNWNGSGAANPATTTGGVSMASQPGPQTPLIVVDRLNDSVTGNFGQNAFTGAVPSGFTAGFPSGAGGAAAQAYVMVMA